MSASVLIILGDRIRSHIEEVVQEQWLMSYIGRSQCIHILVHSVSEYQDGILFSMRVVETF